MRFVVLLIYPLCRGGFGGVREDEEEEEEDQNPRAGGAIYESGDVRCNLFFFSDFRVVVTIFFFFFPMQR